MDTPGARRHRVSKLAHERGGITNSASTLMSPPAAPRDDITLATLRSKQPTEDSWAITNNRAQAEQRAEIIAVDGKAQPDETSEPLDYVQKHIPEVEHLLKIPR